MDHVIENNRALMATLVCVQKRLDAMPADERARTRLPDNLGGRSTAIPKKARQHTLTHTTCDGNHAEHCCRRCSASTATSGRTSCTR